MRAEKAKERFTDVPILRCRFEDRFLRRFLLNVFRNYKKPWGSGNLLSLVLNTHIPCFDKDPEKNSKLIGKMMEAFLKVVDEKERLEAEIQKTDSAIDTKIYELYDLTVNEILAVEEFFRLK